MSDANLTWANPGSGDFSGTTLNVLQNLEQPGNLPNTTDSELTTSVNEKAESEIEEMAELMKKQKE